MNGAAWLKVSKKLKMHIKFFILILSFLVNFSGHLMAAEESREILDVNSIKQNLVLQSIDNQQNNSVDHLFLLPNETLCYIASFFSMKELLFFQQVSKKARDIADLEIIYTNYLNPNNPHRQDISSLFDKVVFDPQPRAIRLKRFAKVENGSIEVRFRDSQHLRDIVEQIPSIEAIENIYFVRDEHVKDGKELIPLNGQLKHGYFVHIVADKPIKITGELNLPCELLLPSQSHFNELKFNGKGINVRAIEAAYCNAHDLAAMLDTFDEHLFKTCTSNAYNLFKHRINDPLPVSLQFSPLLKFCDNILIMSDSTFKILEKKYIDANKPFMYKAKSIAALEKLRKELPEFSQSIGYIDSRYKRPAGVYCLDPLLFLVSGFEIHTDTHLTMAGKIDIPDYNLSIYAGKGIWTFGLTRVARSSILLANGPISINPFHFPIDRNIKPEGMPEEIWQTLLTKIQRRLVAE